MSIILVKGPVDKRATVGDVVSFNCTVAGSQPITYKWYHNGEVLMDDGRIIDSNTSSLTLTSLQLEDYGNYSCTADNPVNMVASDTAELTGTYVHTSVRYYRRVVQFLPSPTHDSIVSRLKTTLSHYIILSICDQ